MLTEKLALGIDIGGTNTAFGVVSEDGKILLEESVSTNDFETADKLAQHIYSVLSQQPYFSQLIGIGIGAPNGNRFKGNIEFAPNLIWKGIVPLAQIFEKQFGLLCIVDNDANIAAVGEMKFGAARNMKNFVTITLGTGLGSGVIVDGKLVYGAFGFAGEYGHVRVEKDGRLCGCSRKGCLETYVSATGVVRSINEMPSDKKASSTLNAIAHPTSLDVVEAANKNDAFAIEILDYTAKMLGEALADFMCFSNPEAFVLFGGMAKVGQAFAQQVENYMNAAALKIYQSKTKVVISTIQDHNAAILGAGALVFHQD